MADRRRPSTREGSTREASTREPGTRRRVLDVSLALLNEGGLAATTTAQVARAAGINEGNLYYYFRRKQDLVTALFDEFEAALLAVARRAVADAPAGYAEYQAGWFRLMWDWRCFYRDAVALIELAPGLRPRLRELLVEGQREVRRVLDAMVAHGLLRALPDELDRLMVNLWIVSSCWINYVRLRHDVAELRPEHLQWGQAQVRSLYSPYLTRAGQAIGQATRSGEAAMEEVP